MRGFLILVGALIALAVAALLAATRIPVLQDALLDRVLPRLAMQSADELLEPDALRVLVCGSASPLPHATRARPCIAVFAGGRFYVVDAGPGSWNNLALWHVPGQAIGAVLLTHFHSDHIGELGEFDFQTWVAGRHEPLRVYGPPGVERVVEGFEEAYALDAGYRIAHHGAALLDPEVGRMIALAVPRPAAGEGPTIVLEENGLVITAFLVDHDPARPAYGYRFDYGGRSAVVSGDTVKDAGLIAAARDADVLLHEAQADHVVAKLAEAAEAAHRPRIVKVLHDIRSYHTTPVEAAEVANEANVRLLVMYHLTPPPPNRLFEPIFTRGVAAVRPNGWMLADDGLLVELPAATQEIRTRSLR